MKRKSSGIATDGENKGCYDAVLMLLLIAATAALETWAARIEIRVAYEPC